MKKILITGFSGFVGRHFLQYLYQNNIDAEIWGVDLEAPSYNYQTYGGNINITFERINLLNAQELRALFCKFVPDYILHLASFSSVAYSWEFPMESFMNNTNIFLNLITEVKEVNKECRILSVGSSEEYGNTTNENIYLQESMVLRPGSPYAVARVSQEMMSRVFVESYHMNIIMTRSFNHIGPWQDPRFVVPNFVNQMVKIKKEKLEPILYTGDISITRDFVDVRDVVGAYYQLLTDGEVGEVYNVCSGKGRTLIDVIQTISHILGIEVSTVELPELIRPNDTRVVIGCNHKIKKKLGWSPSISLEQTLKDMVKLKESENRIEYC